MGFLDKVKDAAKQIKEENRNFGTTMKRINDSNSLFGIINKPDTTVFKMDPNDDFCKNSYLSILSGKGVIYGGNQDDYVFDADSIESFTLVGKSPDITIGNNKMPGIRYTIEFKDGKKAQADIIFEKEQLFKASFGLR